MTPPTGTVTFLFTDVEGSTQRAQSDAAAWSAASARHEQIIRDAVEVNDGFVFKVVGDELCAAFGSASHAVVAALDAQRGLRDEPWRGQPIGVRMGLHAGPARWNDGDYEGYLTLARVERIMSAGHGGQVLVSQVAADLASNELPAGVSLGDLGQQRLKDLREPEHLFQLLAEDLRADFPPLRWVEAPPNNLPAQLTSFVGRQAELLELMTLLKAQRLVTLTGPGGTGKTRLAVELAEDVLEDYSGGAWLIELAPVTDPVAVSRTVASTLRVRDQPGQSIVDLLVDYIRSTQMLLLLDNCEHLIDACASLCDRLLHAAPTLKVVATSREPMGISGEAIFRVPSLPIPDLRRPLIAAEMADIDAVRLFVDRATATDSHFHLTQSNTPAVAKIAVRLDGIPLAIELAAARTKTLTPEEIEERLDDRFRLLTGGSRTALERHQTLQALIDWSHELLSEPERVLLRRLSVFAGGWSLDAARSVCGDGLGEEVLDLLARLADRSLITADEARTAQGESRHRLLETIRQYARDRLLEAGESVQVRDRHLSFFLQLAEVAEPKLRGPEQLEWLDRLETEHGNLRAALGWALESGKVEAAQRLATSLAYFWEFRGHWGEGQRWLDSVAALETPDPASRAKILYWRARLTFAILFDARISRAILEESLALWREVGDTWWIAATLEQLAFVLLIAGDRQEGRERLEEGVALARGLIDRWPLAALLVRLAAVLVQIDVAASIPVRDEAMRVARDVGDRAVLNQALTGLMGMHLMLGDLAAATSAGEEALTLARAIGSATHVLLSYLLLTVAACLEGDGTKATGLAWEALAYTREAGIAPSHGFVIGPFALAALFSGREREGVMLLSAVTEWTRRGGVAMLSARPFMQVTTIALERARAKLDPATFDEAMRLGQTMTAEQALAIATSDVGADLPMATAGKR
jgi:predicted ATPase/class 3 adenylate cyclase